MIDAVLAPARLGEHHDAQEQRSCDNRIHITKTHLGQPHDVATLRQRLVKMKPRARIGKTHHGGSAWKPRAERASKMIIIGRV